MKVCYPGSDDQISYYGFSLMAAGTSYQNNILRGDPSLYPTTSRKQMSFDHWSRHEPIRAELTDHWSKLKCKSYKLSLLPTGNYSAFCRPEVSRSQDYARKKWGLPKSTMVTAKGTLAPVGSPNFNQYLTRRLHNPHLVQPRPPSDSRGYSKIVRVPSASSQRAKLGFKYWTDGAVKTRTTSAGKGTFGSRGTFLGIGVPRL